MISFCELQYKVQYSKVHLPWLRKFEASVVVALECECKDTVFTINGFRPARPASF